MYEIAERPSHVTYFASDVFSRTDSDEDEHKNIGGQ